METDGSRESATAAWELIIIGAGAAGLAARERWLRAGRSCLLLEKSRGMGGRAATKRLADGAFADLGVQYFPEGRGPRIHPEGINRILKAWVAPGSEERSPILFQKKVIEIRREIDGDPSGVLQVMVDSGEVLRARNVMLSAPLPQALGLFSPESFFPGKESLLRAVEFSSCFALLVVEREGIEISHRPAGAPRPGPIASITEQREKGLRLARRVWVLHADEDWSRERWERGDAEILLSLQEAWKREMGASGELERQVDFVLHRWRFSRSKNPIPAPFFRSEARGFGNFYLIGDAFGAGDLEGAWESGVSASLDLIARSAGTGTPKIQPS